MPHLDLTRDEMDKEFPSLSAPEDLDVTDESKWSSWDAVYERGLEIAEEVKKRMAELGRVRRETQDQTAADD